MMEFVGMICRRMFLGLMLMSPITSGAAQPCLISFRSLGTSYCDIPYKATDLEKKIACVGFSARQAR